MKNRGFNFLRVIGRLGTQQEEKNEAETESEATASVHSEAMSNPEDGENETGEDLDANMEDLDDEPDAEEPDENDEVDDLDDDAP